MLHFVIDGTAARKYQNANRQGGKEWIILHINLQFRMIQWVYVIVVNAG
jgi:hypothetical protein